MSQSFTAAVIVQSTAPIQVERNGKVLTLEEGEGVYASDIIKTQDASIELLFADGAKAILGPHSVMTVEEFSFTEGGVSSFVLDLAVGAMRSISGKVVEENPDAFKVFTPRSTVGIRGTDFVTKVNPDGSEVHLVLSLDQGHNLVLTTHDGQQISLTAANQGAYIPAGVDGLIEPHLFTQEEIDALVKQIVGTLKDIESSELEEELKALLEANLEPAAGDESEGAEQGEESDQQGEADQVTLPLDPSVLDYFDNDGTLGTLPGHEDSFQGTTGGSNSNGFGGGSDTVTLLGGDDDDGGHTPAPSTVLSIDGNTSFYADGHTISSGTHVLASQQITITTDIADAVIISGDVHTISGGHVTAGHESITGSPMSDGTVVGDVYNLTGGTLVAGNDTVTFANKTGGDSIYGDAHTVDVGATAHFGHDNIHISQDFTNSTIAGDANTVDVRATLHWGNDTIRVEGNVEAGANIYGDAVHYVDGGGATTTPDGGDDFISVSGTVSGTINAGGGADTVNVGSVNNGAHIDMGAGDNSSDILRIDTATNSSITIDNFDTNTDSLYIDGQKQDISGTGNYGGITITFDNVSGNLIPTFTAPSGTTIGEDATDKNISMQNVQDLNGDTLTFTVKSQGLYGTIIVTDAAKGVFSYVLNGNNSTVQGLNVGDSLQDSFEVTVSDGNGGTVTKTVDVTITGTNDAPTLSVSEANLSVTEDVVQVSVQGQVTAADVDTDSTNLTFSATPDAANPAGTYGTFAIDAQTGLYTFTLNDSSADVQALAAGTSVVLTYTVSVSDGDLSAGQQVTVTITGTNDKPALAVRNVFISEDAISIKGQSTVVDVDTSDTHSYSVTGTTANGYGTVSIDANGEYIFTLNNTLDAIQKLGAGESLTDSFDVTVSDGKGGTDIKTVIVTINGTNDAPTLSVSEPALRITEDAIQVSVGGQATATDVDTDATNLSFSATPDAANLTGNYGNFAIDAQTGLYTFTLDSNSADVQKLAAGSSVTLTYTVNVSDGSVSEGQQVTVTITGTNDAPVLSIVADGNDVTVDESSPNDSVSGSISVTDVDSDGAAQTITINNTDIAGGATITGTYGNLVVAADGTYTYTLGVTAAQIAAVEALGGATPNSTDTFTVKTTDSHGDSDSENLVFTVNGTDDAPMLDVSASSHVVSDGDLSEVVGSFTVGYTDEGDGSITMRYVNASGVSTTVEIFSTKASFSPTTVNTQYGKLIITAYDADAGEFTYSYQQNAAVDHGGNANINERFDLTVSDNDGNTADDATGSITVTITDDAPTAQDDTNIAAKGTGVSGNVLSNDDAGADGWAAGGLVSVTPPDADWTATTVVGFDFAFQNTAGDIIAFTTAGAYTFTAGNSAPAGTHPSYTFTYTVRDADGSETNATLTVNVVDTLDAPPTITVTATDGSVMASGVGRENDGNLAADDNEVYAGDFSASGSLTVDDAEGVALTPTIASYEINGASATQAQVENYGSFTLTQDVSTTDVWNYSFTLNSNNVTALNEGDTVTITYRVEVNDGTTSTYENITVTITGTNDKPALTLTATGNDTSLSEAIADDSVSGSITVVDPDNDGATQDITVDSQNVTGGGIVDGVYGQLVVNADGTYTYTLGVTAAQQAAVDKLTGYETALPTENFTVTTTDAHGATDSKELSFTITGENDKPTISVEELQDWGGGSMSVTDPDASDTEDFTFYVSEQGKDFGSDLGDAADFANGLVLESGTLTLSNGTQVRVYDNGDGAGSYYVDVTYQDALAQDESRNESFTIYVQDEHGAWSSEDVTVTITGENDAPVISLSSTTAEVTAGSVLTASGNISVTDVDSDGAVNGVVLDAQKISVTSQETGASDAESAYNAQGENLTVDGKYGQLLVLADGSYTYTLGVTQAQKDALAAMDPTAPAPTETFEITSTDKHGAEDSQSVTITVNPAPAQNPFLGLDTDTEVTKLSFDQSVSGTFAHDDDSIEITTSLGETKFAITNNATDVTTFDGTYGTLTVYGDGSYSYELYKYYQSNADALNALVSGSAQDTFTIVTRDGNTETGREELVITVNGAADGGPITFETDTDAVVKTGSLDDIRVEGRFEINSDSSFTLTYDADADNIADAGESVMQYALGENTLVTEYGTLSIGGSDGLFFYSFVLDVNADATRALLAGEKKELHYILRTDSGYEQTLVITVVGENIDSNVLKEQDGNLESGGTLIGDANDATAFTSSWMTVKGDVTGDVTGSSIVVGDAHTYTGTGHMAHGGNDFIKVTGNALTGATIVGDVYADDSFSLSTPGRDKDLSVAASGNDSIMVEGELAGATIVGDSYVYSEFSDSEYDLRAEGGSDTISVGSMSSGFIYGDNRNDASDDGGEDSISVLGSMSGGEIHGQGGGNIISVGDTLSAGIIYAGDGHDIVSVQNMSGGAIYGQGGDNSLNIANLSGIAEVRGGEGTDTFTIGKMTGGALYGGAGDDIFVISKDSYTGGTIDGGSDAYGYDKDIIHFTDTITQAFTPDGFGGSNIINIEGYTFEKITSTGSVSMTEKHVVNVHSLEGSLTMGANADATVFVGDMSVGATVQTSAGNDEIRVTNMTGGTVYSDAGDDTLRLSFMTKDAVVYGGAGDDLFYADHVDTTVQGSLHGESGNDTFTIGSNLLDQLTIDGGDGIDTLEVSIHDTHNLNINMADLTNISHMEMYDFTFYNTGITLQGSDDGQNINVLLAKEDSTNTIILGSGNDSLALKSYYENSHVTVEMTGGDDTISLGSFDSGSSVTFSGFSDDTLTVGGKNYTESSTVTLEGGGTSTLGYAVDNNLTVNFDGLTVYFTS